MQTVTLELRQWIVDQAVSGQAPQAVLKSMLSSGWNEAVAIQALEDTLQQHLAQREAEEALPSALKVPEPLPQGFQHAIWAADREVVVVSSLRSPRVVVFANLLSRDECDELMALAQERLARSETVQTDTGSTEVNEARTSQGMFFERGEHAVCSRIETRIAALLSWPIEHGEGLQVLRYGPGAQYKPHYDYFDPEQPGTPGILQRGGQRVGSLVCYLNTPAKGGATVFPDVHLEVAPIQGHAVFFSYNRPHPSTLSLHGGAPVTEGEKWVATKWLRERVFV
jgi:prolyl 4-hydroxylase